jgi:hypothetical protein
LDLGRVVGEGTELPGVEQDFIDARRRGREVDFLVDGGAGLVALGVRRGGPDRRPSGSSAAG